MNGSKRYKYIEAVDGKIDGFLRNVVIETNIPNFQEEFEAGGALWDRTPLEAVTEFIMESLDQDIEFDCRVSFIDKEHRHQIFYWNGYMFELDSEFTSWLNQNPQ